MATTQAIVLDDGQVMTKSQMDSYVTKDQDGSRQIPADSFAGSYDGGLVEPLYNLEALSRLPEINTYHYRAVKTKARDVAGLGWSIVAQEGVDNPAEKQKKEIIAMLDNCNPDYSLVELLDMMMVDFETTGNGYMEIIRSKTTGLVVGFEHIPAHTVRIHHDMIRYVQQRGGRKVWFKQFGIDQDVNYATGVLSALKSVDEDKRGTEIIHLKNYTSRSDYYGLPDVVSALGAVLGDRERQEYNISFFENHAIPAYAVTVSGANLDEDTENKIKKFFQKDVKNNSHSTLVLTAKPDPGQYDQAPVEFKFEKLDTDVHEASFTMFRKENRDEILSAHGVPPYRAGIVSEGQMGGSSASETTEIYKQSVIKPKQDILEGRLNKLILGQGLGITDWIIQLGEIDTRDENQELAVMERLFKMGYYSPNELRENRGDERIDDPDMDQRFIDGKPIDQAAEAGGGGGAFMSQVKQLHTDLVRQAVTKDV